jgi:hypothetical protein
MTKHQTRFTRANRSEGVGAMPAMQEQGKGYTRRDFLKIAGLAGAAIGAGAA